MSFDKFKNIKPMRADITSFDAEYLKSVAALTDPKPKKSILPIIGTVAAAVLVIVGVSAWALIGRGVRGTEQDDEIIVLTPAKDSDTFEDKPQDKEPEKDDGKKPDDENPGKDENNKPVDTDVTDTVIPDGGSMTVTSIDITENYDKTILEDSQSKNSTYLRYLRSVITTRGSVLIRGKKSGDKIEVIKAFYGNVKQGDMLFADTSELKENSEYIFSMVLSDGKYVGNYPWLWYFEIKNGYPQYSGEETIEDRILEELAYTEVDKSYVPDKPQNEQTEFISGLDRIGLDANGTLSYFKYKDDVFPHYTRFADVDIYSTPVTSTLALMHYQKTAELTYAAATYKSHFVWVCETPEQMKNDKDYEIVIVEQLNGKRHAFYKRRTAVYFENEYFVKAYAGPNSSVIAYRPDHPDTYFQIYYDSSISVNELDGFCISRYFVQSDEVLNTAKGEIKISFENVHPISKSSIDPASGMI